YVPPAAAERGGALHDLARTLRERHPQASESSPLVVALCGGSPSASVAYAGEFKSGPLARFVNKLYRNEECAAALAQVGSEADLASLRVGQLKTMLAARGEACADCVEKGDFVARLRALMDAGQAQAQ
ncbi:hypothetical protein H632_c1525p0, partial [Helicosporidium sp. ATCC 50920]